MLGVSNKKSEQSSFNLCNKCANSIICIDDDDNDGDDDVSDNGDGSFILPVQKFSTLH